MADEDQIVGEDGEEIEFDEGLEKVAKRLHRLEKNLQNSPKDPAIRSVLTDWLIPIIRTLAAVVEAGIADVADVVDENNDEVSERLDAMGLAIRHIGLSSQTVGILIECRKLAQRALVEKWGNAEDQARAEALIEATDIYSAAEAAAAPAPETTAAESAASASTPAETPSAAAPAGC